LFDVTTIQPYELPQTCPQVTLAGAGGFTGSLANVILYPEALSDDEIADIASNTPCSTSFVVSYCLHTDNSYDSHLAGPGQTIIMTIDSPVNITSTPTVVCNGHMNFHVTGDGSTFTGTYVVQSTDEAGDIACEVSNLFDQFGTEGTSTVNPLQDCHVTIGEF
jgi:hypothetical protein